VHEHNWDAGVVTQAPSETAIGIKTYTCSCGETQTEVLPKLFGTTSINMGNSLDIIFKFRTANVAQTGYVEFIREYADKEAVRTVVQLSDTKYVTVNGSYYRIVYPGVAAKEMCDNVTVTVYDADGNAVSETKTDSIRSYAHRGLAASADPIIRKLLVDMLNYGAAMQGYFTYATDNLANSLMTPAQKAEGTQVFDTYDNLFVKPAGYNTTSIIFKSNISVNFRLNVGEFGTTGRAEVSYTNHLGTTKNITISNPTVNGSLCVFTLEDIVVADARCPITVKFYNGAGDLVVSITDSLESYCARGLAASATTYAWLNQFMAFSDSAHAYLHRNDK
jgi:hypothetical protein